MTAVRLLRQTPAEIGYTLQVTPNPVETTALVRFTVPETGVATVDLYDALGQRVRQLYSGTVTPGETTLELNTGELPAGTYIVKVSSGIHTAVERITIVR